MKNTRPQHEASLLRIGLVEPAGRSQSGYRLYAQADVERLRFVLQAKRAGFTLAEIAEVLRRSEDGTACGFVRATLRRHLAALDEKIVEMQRVRRELQQAQIAWRAPEGSGDGTFCGLIEQWTGDFPSPEEVKKMTNKKRKVEVFSAGCPLCDPVVEMVQRLACDNCDVTIHDLRDAEAARHARAAGVHRAPMVLVNGQPAACCEAGPVTEAGLRAAGVGAS